MRGSKNPLKAAGLLSSLLLLLLTATAPPIAAEAGGHDDAGVVGGGGDGGTRSGSVEWETVAKSNFSSQIRLNPHVLLIITVPWSGESRSLMKDIANLVANSREELRFLKLLVVSRHSEKMLADVLGASDGITLFYYHYSISYKYQGRLRAQNVLASIYHFMSLQTEEAPLKPLHTQKDLETFSQSTDKAVLLLEFCGWSNELLHRRNPEDDETTTSIQNRQEHGGFLEENISRKARGQQAFEMMKDQKIQALESEELSYGFQSGVGNSPLLEGFTRANESNLQGTGYRSSHADISCTAENFEKFKSFFPRFMKIAREYFLPPERQRFGLISERSLLPFLKVDSPETWLVLLNFSGCSNCSIILGEGDNLRNILQMPHSLVKELDVDGNLDSVLPATRPSVILFVDRSSDSSKIKGESKLALQVFREFVRDYHFDMRYNRSNLQSSSGEKGFKTWSQATSGHSFHQRTKVPVAPKIVKFKDNMAIISKDTHRGISLGESTDSQVDSLFDSLAQLLHQKKHVLKTKETKISLLAKEVGFQLLSDDFEVQVIDSSPTHTEDSQLNYIDDNAIANLEDQTGKLTAESNKDSLVRDTILVDSNNLVSFDEKKQPELIYTESSPQQGQVIVPHSESNTNRLTNTLVEELQESTQLTMEAKSFNQDNSQSFTCSVNDSSNMEKGTFIIEESIEIQKMDQAACNLNKTCTIGSEQNLSGVMSSEVLERKDAAEIIQPIIDEWHVRKLPLADSFFFFDGGYQLLKSLTGGTKIPSLVILDPALQQHYVFPEDTDISYSSLVNFVGKFLNGSLTPFRRTMSPVKGSRKFPQPPFVNRDFHETDSIPQVTANTFCEVIFGYEPCDMEKDLSIAQIENFRFVWKMDILVLFSTPWCGFCQRMELIVREVYRALEYFTGMLKSESMDWDSMYIQDGLPSFFLMDCTLNDCGSLLKSMGKVELYPTLLLFPAENKTAITYEGYMSVINIIEFLMSHGRNSHYLTKHSGFLFTHSWTESKHPATLYDQPAAVHERTTSTKKKYSEIHLDGETRDDHLPIGSHTNNLDNGGHHVRVGSILASTNKLLNSVPFDKSTVLIVKADQNQGFQGLITNKRISWDIFKELDQEMEVLKQAPLFYGGPISTKGLPLVSLARKPVEGYGEVISSIYFGDPLATRLTLEEVKSGDRSASEYWFFLGYSAWAWDQLFNELAAGAWNLNESPVDWPDI